jgi:hypothetical protein
MIRRMISLEGNEKLQSCLVSNPVCGLRAKTYAATSVTNTRQLETLYRERCSGYLPLNWFQSNMKDYLLRQMIENIFTTDTFSDEEVLIILLRKRMLLTSA